MKQLLTIACLLFGVTALQAQKLDLGKVTIEELAQKQHPTDPSAPAAVLFEKGDVSFSFSDNNGFMMTTTVKTKIKIYTKEGYEYATEKVRYYNDGSTKELLRFSDAVTYNLVDGKIVKTKLKSDGEFDEKVNRYWSAKKITMPAVQEGCIIEYSYALTTPLFSQMEDWSFQSDIPVNYSEFRLSTPEYYMYKPNMTGYHPVKVTQNTVSRSIISTAMTRSGGLVTRTGFSTDKLDYLETQTTYVAENVPAMHEEAFVNNINNYRTAVSHELSAVRWPNKPIKTYSTDWESLVKTIYASDDFGPELNKTGYFEEDLAAITVAAKTPEEKIALIFQYVKATMNWDGYMGYSCNDGVKKAYKAKTGNVAEINLMLTAMLRYAGINANPVILSTRSNGIAYFPNRQAFNYVIAAVEVPNGLILLDATNKNTMPGVLPTRDLNWFGRLIRKDGSSTDVDLFPKAPSKEMISVMGKINTDGSVTGKCRKQFSDNIALSFRDRVMPVKEEAYLESLENQYGGIELSDYKRENIAEISKPVLENYSFKKENAYEIIGDKIYVRPMLFLGDTENPFKVEKREYPVDFSYPTEYKFNINLELPEGYVVETLPTSASISMEGNACAFKYMTAVNGKTLQVICTMAINDAIVGPEQYETLKNYFQKVIDKQMEKVVLKKA